MTDSEGVVRYDVEHKPGVSNLLTIYSVLTNQTIETAEKHFENANYGTLKAEVADAVVNALKPVQTKYFEYLENKSYLDEILNKGRVKASIKASEKIKEIYNALGLII